MALAKPGYIAVVPYKVLQMVWSTEQGFIPMADVEMEACEASETSESDS